MNNKLFDINSLPFVQSNFTPHWTIYTKSNCVYCTKVKELLEKEKLITFINCDNLLLDDRDGFLDTIEQYIGYRYSTFPMVFESGNFVGGYNETVEYLTKPHDIVYTDDF